MYINKYDILLDKEFDILLKKIKVTDYNSLIKNLNNLDKLIDLKKFIEISKKNGEKIKQITKNIISKYLVCLISFFSKDKLDIIKTNLIKSEYFNSEDLGKIFKLYDEVNLIKSIANEENLENLENEYKNDIKTKNTIDFLNKLGFEYVTNNIKGNKQENIHNIIKTVIFKRYYQKNFRKIIFDFIQDDDDEYEFIEIVVPEIEIIDYSNIENILKFAEKKDGLTQEIFDFMSFYENKKIEKYSLDEYSNILMKNNIIYPIVDDFLRYHKISEKYEKNTNTKIDSKERDNKRDQTKIRYIISKTDKIKDYYSKKIQNNSTLKKEVDKQFYKPLIHRKAVIINEIEELSIINKLKKQGKTAIESNEFYHDLLNLRKYAYVNFKDINGKGFNLHTTDSITGIRYAQIESLHNQTLSSKSLPIETRVLGKNTKSNIVGVALIKDNLNKLRIKNMTDIKTSKNDNSYNDFFDKIANQLETTLDKNYYWIFAKDDVIKTDTFEANENKVNNERNIVKSIYWDFSNLLYNKILSKIKEFDTIDLYYSNKIIDFYQRKFFNLNQVNYKNENLYDDLQVFIKSKIPHVKDTYDEMEDKIFGLTGEFIKLPKIKNEKNDVAKIYISSKENTIIEEELDVENAYCQHIIDWTNLSQLRSNNPNRHTELLYSFIEKYVMTNNDNEYICKSCNQLLDIQSFLSNIYDGGSEGIDIVLTSTKPLDEIYEYSKFKSSIKNMDKLTERIAQITNFNFLIGNLPVHKFRRQDITKQTIDLINIHDETLRTNNMNKRERERKATKNYGISSDNSNYFIFPLSNDIFKFSSKETDKFKKIKLNNVITYIMLFIFLEMNITQLMNIEFDKNCNLFLFEKFGFQLFENLYIRIDSSNKIVPIKNYKSLCLVIFYYSCMISKYKLWYHPNAGSKNFSYTFMQKDIVHTFVDMLNSIMEVYSEEDKHFMYKILGSKFSNKLTNVFKNEDIIQFIKNKEKSKIIIDNNANKIKFVKSKIKSVNLDGNMNFFKDTLYDFNTCRPNIYYIKKKMPERVMTKILGNEINEINNNFMKQDMKNVSKIYDKNGNFLKNKLSDKEVNKLNISQLKEIYNKVEKNKLINLIKEKKNINFELIKNNFNSIKKDIDNIDYIQKFIDIIDNDIGNSVKINNLTYKTNEDQILIDHDYLGNKIDTPIYLDVSDKKVKIKDNSDLKIKVFEINDKSNDIILFYNYSTFHFIGYKDSSRGFIDMKQTSSYIKYIPSIKTLIKTLGFKKFFYKIDIKKDAENEIRAASYNLKEYIRQIDTGLNQIRYKINRFDINPITKHYLKKISKLELRGEKGKIFKNRNDFVKVLLFSIETTEIGTVSALELSNISKSHNELINYMIQQVITCLGYNNDKFIRSNLIFYFLSFFVYFYNLDFEQYTEFEMIKFNYILNINEDISDVSYNDNNDDISEEDKEERINQEIDDNERLESLDTEQNGDEEDEETLFENVDN